MTMLEKDNIKDIKPGLNQVFSKKHTLSIGYKEIIKLKNAGIITNRDLMMTQFFFKFTFATATQIYEYLKAIDEDLAPDCNIIRSRLNKLVKHRVLNKFKLVDEENVKSYYDYPKDSLDIYCMDVGGRYLLANYSNEDTADWFTVETMKISENVKRQLFITEFFVQLYKTSGDKVVFFNIHPEMRVGRSSVNPSFEICLNDNGKNIYYIGEVILDMDLPGEFRSKSIRLESLLSTNAWKKYYHDVDNPPPLLFLTESDYSGLDASRLFYRTTEIKSFRTTTIDRIKNPFYEAGVFMKYIDSTEGMEGVISSKFKKD